MKITLATQELLPRHAFRIARVRRHPVRNVFLRLEHEGLVAYGEASPNAYYHETAESVLAKLQGVEAWLADRVPETVEEIAARWEESWTHLAPSRAAQCALDLALWDLVAKKRGLSVAELALGAAPGTVTSFCTIGLSTPEELAVKIHELRGFPRVKIKSDAAADLQVVREVRAQLPAAELALDANAAWQLDQIPAKAAALAELGVLFLEQPLAPAENRALARGAYALPIMADESCVTEAHVQPATEHFDGFNIKLVKCGGLTPGLRMLRHGRALGSRVMVGCMLESSLLIAAGAVVAQQADFADLDGAWLLRNDPFSGLQFIQGQLQPSPQAGFGVAPLPSLFG